MTVGVTHLLDGTPTGITIRAGLPRMSFGSTIAHESLHVWIHQHRIPPLAPPVEEGLCQLAADEWLRRQSDPRAGLLRRAIATSPDPVYGAGFRAARDALGGRRVGELLRYVGRYGVLP
ncbi:protein DA1 [Micromonospora sp. WMMD736]|uniref:protein DA1 n=1 Tax=Micromonospora sp. WMMD736 TaxID=3404112 RepID=UPI003B94E592